MGLGPRYRLGDGRARRGDPDMIEWLGDEKGAGDDSKSRYAVSVVRGLLYRKSDGWTEAQLHARAEEWACFVVRGVCAAEASSWRVAALRDAALQEELNATTPQRHVRASSAQARRHAAASTQRLDKRVKKATIRQLREAAGLTQAELARRVVKGVQTMRRQG